MRLAAMRPRRAGCCCWRPFLQLDGPEADVPLPQPVATARSDRLQGVSCYTGVADPGDSRGWRAFTGRLLQDSRGAGGGLIAVDALRVPLVVSQLTRAAET